MSLSLKSFSQLVQDMGAVLQSSATSLIDVSIGSVTRALFEANAGIALWMQWLILQVLQTTRASTSTGADLDSWMADFGLTRLPASPSSGVVTFLRYATNLPASIPEGTVVKTVDGSLSFSVVASEAISIWNVASSAYVLPADIATATIPVICNQPGTKGNVVSGSITTIASSLPGIDQVTNLAPFTAGQDAETDILFRARFVEYLAALSRATPMAIQSAVSNVRQSLVMSLLENTASDGSVSPGAFLVIIDDGSGFPSTELISAVANAVESVRPVGTTMSVIGPVVVSVSVTVTVLVQQTSALFAQASSSVQLALEGYLNSIPIGKIAALSRVIQAAYSAVPDIENVTNVSLNGGAQDIDPGLLGVIKAGVITVSVNAD
jgi:uncharacterized phage protein gp47/JayE